MEQKISNALYSSDQRKYFLFHTTIVDSTSAWKTIYFVPVCCFVVWNVFDYLGKSAATYIKLPGPSPTGQSVLLIVSVLRIGFIPLLIFCNVAPNNRVTEVRATMIYSQSIHGIWLLRT